MILQLYPSLSSKIEFDVGVFHKITGNLKVREVAVAVVASAEHRKEAFDACRYGIDEIKIRLPIWKKEVSDSSISWVQGVSSKSE